MLITVIIPCFNSRETIVKCVDSVFNQTYRNLEIICINDGSADETLSILTDIKSSSPFPFTIINQQNQGACAARNAGLQIATGDYIQFLDADDELKPEKIKNQVALLAAHKSVDLIIAPYENKMKNDVKLFLCHTSDFWSALIIGRAGFTGSNLFSRKIIIAAGGWNNKQQSSQETELLFRIFKKSANIIFSDKIETIKNDRAFGSISSTNKEENWERAIALRIEINTYLKTTDALKAERETAFKQMIFDSIRTLYYLNQEKAIGLYYSLVNEKFAPVKSDATSGIYLLFYRILGFKNTQLCFSFFRKQV